MTASPDDYDPEGVIRESRSRARRLSVQGEHWLVFELLMPYDRRGATLVFESDSIVRRVRAYPPNWRELPDHDLYALSWDT